MTSGLCATDLKGNPDLLIKEVHVRRPIWDLKSPAHHNRDIVHKLWTEISSKLGLPMDIIKNKWKHLRDNFRTELKKTVRGSGNPPQPYQSQWTFFNDLLFLEEQMMKKISRLYTPTDLSNNEREGDAESNENNLMGNSTDFLTHSLFDDSPSTQEPLTWWLQNDANISAPNGHVQNNKRRRYNCDFDTVTMTILNDNSLTSKMKMHPNSLTSSIGNDDVADDDYHFMMSLLPFIKSLEAPRKMYLRVKLQELICDFVYNIKCNSTSNHCNTTRRLNKATCTNCNISSNSAKSEPKKCIIIKEEPSNSIEHNQDPEEPS